jgi:hypothetical protein
MARKNWETIAKNQFESLDQDIKSDWVELRNITLSNDR